MALLFAALLLGALVKDIPLWLFALLTVGLEWPMTRFRQIAIFVEPEQVRYVELRGTEIVIPLQEIKRVEVRHVFTNDALRLHLHNGQFIDFRFLKRDLESIAAHLQDAAGIVQQRPA